jgi:hypothetical protein
VRWRQTTKTPGLAQRLYGEFKRSGLQPPGNRTPAPRCLMGQFVREALDNVTRPYQDRCWTDSDQRLTRMNLIYPASTKEPAVAGIGCPDNHHLTSLVECIRRNLGDLVHDVKESGIREVETPLESLRCMNWESAWPSYSERGKAAYRAKGHSLRGGCVVTLLNDKAVNAVQGQEKDSGHKSSQAVAVCGESRTHGDNGGDGKTQFGCASCPYPLVVHHKAAWRVRSWPISTYMSSISLSSTYSFRRITGGSRGGRTQPING